MKTLLENTTVETPAGAFWLAAKDGALVAAGFAEARPRLLARLEARFGPLDVREAEVGLIHEGGRLKAVPRALAGHAGPGDLVEVAVHDDHDCVEGAAIPAAPLIQQARYVVLGLVFTVQRSGRHGHSTGKGEEGPLVRVVLLAACAAQVVCRGGARRQRLG